MAFGVGRASLWIFWRPAWVIATIAVKAMRVRSMACIFPRRCAINHKPSLLHREMQLPRVAGVEGRAMAYESLALLEKLEEVSSYTRIALRQFPKYEKFLLGAEIRGAITEIKRLMIRASKRYYKKTTLEDLDIEIELLRSLVRESVSMEYIDLHRYEVWSLKIGEVGKMVGAWMKNVRAASQPADPAPKAARR